MADNGRLIENIFTFIIFVIAILATADLEKISSKEVRNQLQVKLKTDFSQRKKEIDKIIMEVVNSLSNESSAESEPEVAKPKKRKADSSEESDYKPSKSTKKRRGSSSGSEEWKETKKKKTGQKYTGKQIDSSWRLICLS